MTLVGRPVDLVPKGMVGQKIGRAYVDVLCCRSYQALKRMRAGVERPVVGVLVTTHDVTPPLGAGRAYSSGRGQDLPVASNQLFAKLD